MRCCRAWGGPRPSQVDQTACRNEGDEFRVRKRRAARRTRSAAAFLRSDSPSANGPVPGLVLLVLLGRGLQTAVMSARCAIVIQRLLHHLRTQEMAGSDWVVRQTTGRSCQEACLSCACLGLVLDRSAHGAGTARARLLVTCVSRADAAAFSSLPWKDSRSAPVAPHSEQGNRSEGAQQVP